ncbi:MAG: hypothetical protein GC137_08745 [Alphaproteobacteria bacterium]|nr:hypothetical protein [Alphaproteobacteria bacterium]
MMIDMPWWAWGYLFVVIGIFIASFFTPREISFNRLSASACSLFSICTFVIAFFHSPIAHFLGLFLVPMTLIGIYWEFVNAADETSEAQDYLNNQHDIDEGERAFLLNVAIGLNALVIVPGYVLGILLSVDVLQRLFAG